MENQNLMYAGIAIAIIVIVYFMTSKKKKERFATNWCNDSCKHNCSCPGGKICGGCDRGGGKQGKKVTGSVK